MRKIKQKYIDLNEKLSHSSEAAKSHKKSAKFRYIAGGTACLVLIIVSYVGSRVYLVTAQDRYDQTSAKVNDPELQAEIADDEIITAKNAALTQIIAKYNENRDAISLSARLDGELTGDIIKNILACQTENISVTNVNFDGEYFSITGVCKYADLVSDYVSALDSKNMFSSISYTGFSGEGEMYTFTISAQF